MSNCSFRERNNSIFGCIFPQLVMNGGSCLNPTFIKMSTVSATLLWSATGEFQEALTAHTYYQIVFHQWMPVKHASLFLVHRNQVHVRVWGLLRDAAQRRTGLQASQLPGLPGRGGLRRSWAGSPLHLEQRPLCPLGAHHGQQKPEPCTLLSSETRWEWRNVQFSFRSRFNWLFYCFSVSSVTVDERCYRFSDCASCTANTNGCQWCDDKKCIAASSNCSSVSGPTGGARGLSKCDSCLY